MALGSNGPIAFGPPGPPGQDGVPGVPVSVSLTGTQLQFSFLWLLSSQLMC